MPANVALSITEDDLYKALGDFLQGLFVDVEIERTQQNGVQMPLGDFIAMTSLYSAGLSTGVVTYSAPDKAGLGMQHITRTTQWKCQLDFYGQIAERNALMFATLIRSEFATAHFRCAGGAISPLYCSEPLQTTMINGEQQYETRWTLDFVAQINPVVNAPLAFFDNVTIQTTITESIDGNSN
ncbi:phage neck terminator protein [Serratia odorifera]|uniref:Phage neck terminator protein gp12-like domain-containing protein n=2 Tax=Serratia odorifera TaxID=618 RepID=D4E7E2_SEROD|nr:hypothetical protein [Serratia odorifera]EFE93997.1 hypothetical protein HMPREF0758_4092 [Serratia odorifera DSM 4582]PNK89128.1 hypothetical protein CEQ31_005125 [Serratia odorifera]RII69842.1 hypothetical protein DX901_21170 [Serratia odorifera]VDZ64117.1 Uncharacterised protein [Serratia odorifera]